METMMFIFQFSLDIFISFLQISFYIFIDNFYSSLANIFVEKTLRVTHIQSYGIVLWGQTHRESISMRYVLVYCCPQNSGIRILSHQTSDGRRETSLSWCGTSPTWLADSMRQDPVQFCHFTFIAWKVMNPSSGIMNGLCFTCCLLSYTARWASGLLCLLDILELIALRFWLQLVSIKLCWRPTSSLNKEPGRNQSWTN